MIDSLFIYLYNIEFYYNLAYNILHWITLHFKGNLVTSYEKNINYKWTKYESSGQKGRKHLRQKEF